VLLQQEEGLRSKVRSHFVRRGLNKLNNDTFTVEWSLSDTDGNLTVLNWLGRTQWTILQRSSEIAKNHSLNGLTECLTVINSIARRSVQISDQTRARTRQQNKRQIYPANKMEIEAADWMMQTKK